MRKTTIVGPLLLIAVGILFLVRNFFPEVRILGLLAVYWPYALILWGVLRLVEVVRLRQQGQLTRRDGVTGGEWGGIVAACVMGSILFTVHRPQNWNLPNIEGWGPFNIVGESYEFPVNLKQTQVPANARIILDNSRGDAKIIGVAGLTEISVSGLRKFSALSKGEAEAAAAKEQAQIVREGDAYVIKTNIPGTTSGHRASATVEVQIPAGASLECRGKYGDFDVSKLLGNVKVDSDNAGVRISEIGGNVFVELRRSDIVRVVDTKGSVEIRGKGSDVEVENIAGPVSVNGSYSDDLVFRKLARGLHFESSRTNFRVEKAVGMVRFEGGDLVGYDLQGPIVLRGSSKDVELSDFSDTVELDVDRGDLTLRPGKSMGKIVARTGSGDIEFAVPEMAKLTMEAKTRRGRIDDETGAGWKLQEDNRTALLSGSSGAGPRVELLSERGDIRVRKATAEDRPSPEMSPEAPLPPPPPRSPKDARNSSSDGSPAGEIRQAIEEVRSAGSETRRELRQAGEELRKAGEEIRKSKEEAKEDIRKAITSAIGKPRKE